MDFTRVQLLCNPSEPFSSEDVGNVVFFVDYATHLAVPLHQTELRLQTLKHGSRNTNKHIL